MYVVLDTETTGRSFFKGDRLIEIGACKYINREYVDSFHAYINPQCAVSLGALKVHGLSDQFLKDKPLFSDIAKDFLEFVQGAALVIHNAPFDIGFLDNELGELNLPKLKEANEIIDTLPMARKMYPGQRNSLDALCKRLGVDASAREKHGALLDARLLAEVYLIMTAKQHAMDIGQAPDNIIIESDEVKVSDNIYLGANEEELTMHKEFIEKYLSE